LGGFGAGLGQEGLLTIFLKDPAAELAYAVDWGAEYLAGQTIVDASWTIAPDEDGGLVAASPQIVGGQATVRLTGGRVGRVYRVTNQVVFSDSGRDERALVVRVEDR
jgi:hypothetical protein